MTQAPLPAPSAIIFDLDGTLADTLADLAEAMNRALQFHGYPGADISAYRQRIGWGLRELARRSLPADVHEQQLNAVITAFQAIYFTEPVRKTAAYPGMPALLEDLAQRHIPLFVHTNKPDAPATVIIHRLFGSTLFRGVLGQREDMERKPSPQGVRFLLSLENLSPSGCWYIGDSEVDIATAHAAGCASIAAAWGFRPAEFLKEADYICADASELRELILSAL
ncbi:MAG: hypothetical protein B0D92_08120 [Spirochaeta sp. LUC14_002_19_P3]|nr:MAG: hypothetical protein B0D92_08120 [Spirochaeta sp. LUC14_002_19_P3]